MILITNDDGISSPGILALRTALADLDSVFVVAPDRERSSIGMAITLHHPLRSTQVSTDIYAVDGTPVDCVDLAIASLMPQPPTLIVSGINKGENLGHDVHFSGTLAAARKGVLLGIPAIAISLVGWRGNRSQESMSTGHEQDQSLSQDLIKATIDDTLEAYQPASQIACRLVKQVLSKEIPNGSLLNVNIPNVPLAEIGDFTVTRQDRGGYSALAVKRADRYGNPYYWIGGERARSDIGHDTDIYALQQNQVSVTPITVDLTDYQHLNSLKTWINS